MATQLGAVSPEPVDRHGPAVVDVLARFEELCGPVASTVETPQDYPQRQCAAAAEVLAFDAVGLSITYSQDDRRVPLAASSAEVVEAEALEFSLGDGPGLHAVRANAPVLIPDLADQSSVAWSRWPQYAESMLSRTSFRAVFALPLSSRGLTLGAVCLYRAQPSMVDFTELGDALAVTNRIFDDLIASGTFSGQEFPLFRWLDLPSAQPRGAVWQALGLATVELGVSPADALALLRAHSYQHNQLLDDVAVQVLDRRLKLDQLHP